MKTTDQTSMFDFLSILALLFAALFVLSFIQIAVDRSKKNVEAKAEYMVTVEWPNDLNDDVDTYLEYNNHFISHFSAKETPVSNLERDDLGHVNDYLETQEGGKIVYNENLEMMTIRTAPKGVYILNIHMYLKRSPGPTSVKVKIEKLNPYSVILQKKFELNANGDEITVCRLHIGDKGQVQKITYEPKRLAAPPTIPQEVDIR